MPQMSAFNWLFWTLFFFSFLYLTAVKTYFLS